jgi:predicted P-loop ATPase
MSLIARTTRAPISVEGALAIARPSIAAMPVDPEGLDYWESVARGCYERALKRRLEKDASEERVLARVIGTMAPKNVPEKNLGSSEPEDWQARFARRQNKDGTDAGLTNTPRNAYLIFKYDPAWAGLLKFDVLHKTLIVRGTPLEGVAEQAQEAAATAWLSEHCHLDLAYGVVSTELMHVALETLVDPLADYLKSVKRDGESRLDTFLTNYLGVLDDPPTRRISRRWLISCVARALKPGAKVDTVLVLVGKQGSMKSTSLGILAGEFFSDTAIDMGSKDGRSAASNHWIIELSELTSLRRADDETTKAFLSAAVDSYRPPYAKIEVTRPRRCVFVGSTNQEEFLRDITGNRRYWPVLIGTIDTEALLRDRDAIWAEAVEAFLKGERWWLDSKETDEQEQRNAEHMQTSHWSQTIAQWIVKMPVAQRPKDVTVDQIALDCLGFTKPQLTMKLTQEIAAALKQLGFTKERSMRNGQRAWRWVTPKSLLPDIGVVQ